MPHENQILFVCTGNTCRSPMAEYLFRAWAGPKSEWRAVSAGIAAFPGIPASRAAIATMKTRGIDMTQHRSQPLSRELIDQSAAIVVMARTHMDFIREHYIEAKPRLFMFSAFGPGRIDKDIADPIGGAESEYRDIASELERIMPDLLLRLHEKFGTLPDRKRG